MTTHLLTAFALPFLPPWQ